MNFYSNELFCEAFGRAYFPTDMIQPQVYKLNDKLWRIPTLNYKQPVTSFLLQSNFIDFYEPWDGLSALSQQQSSQESFEPIPYIPRVSYGMAEVDEWFEQNLHRTYDAAPTVRWDSFDSWEDFVRHVRQRESKLFTDNRRRQRKLERAVGPLNFVFDDKRPEVLTTCMAWKSSQYQRSGLIDNFAYEGHVRLFQELAKTGLLVASSLSSNEQILAIHLGVLSDQRFYSWVPAYDPAYSAYSPGRLLLLFMLEESFRRGYQEFDFFIGDETYKWNYATHTRLIAELGTPPLALQLTRTLESSLKPALSSALNSFPTLKQRLQAVRQTLNEKIYQLDRK